jgi:hypothetical protein
MGEADMAFLGRACLQVTHIPEVGLRAMVRLVGSGHPPLPDIGRSFGGSDALRVNTSVRGEVVDLAARDTDIH